MKVVKKLNNNVAMCIDDNGEQLVAFGKGIGFPPVPYDLTDMEKISMTFYKLNMQYFQLLKDVPSEIFDISSKIVIETQELIPKRALSSNLLFSLADHINFALTRIKDYQGLQLPFSYDVKHLYPKETKIGYDAVAMINEHFHVQLPLSEVTAIAMHLVNSQFEKVSVAGTVLNDDNLIEYATKIIEQEFDLILNREEFTYNRFVMHLRYYLKRIHQQTPLNDSNNFSLFNTMRNEEPQIYLGAKRIADYIDEQLKTKSSQDEIFYLMIYVRRIVNKKLNK